MFSISYLYSIKDNFAILYKGNDKKIVEKIHEIIKKVEYPINIVVFVKNDLMISNFKDINEWKNLEKNFAKYFEVTVNPKNPTEINNLL